MYNKLNIEDIRKVMKEIDFPYIGLAYKGEGLEIYQIGTGCYTGRQGYIEFVKALDKKAKEMNITKEGEEQAKIGKTLHKNKALDELDKHIHDNPCDLCSLKYTNPEACELCNTNFE